MVLFRCDFHSNLALQCLVTIPPSRMFAKGLVMFFPIFMFLPVLALSWFCFCLSGNLISFVQLSCLREFLYFDDFPECCFNGDIGFVMSTSLGSIIGYYR